MKDVVRVVMEFGITLVEKQHDCFVNETLDNSEHVPAIRRIAEAAYAYLKSIGIDIETAKKVRHTLIGRGRELFVSEWMMSCEEFQEPLTEKDRREAKRTFDELLKSE